MSINKQNTIDITSLNGDNINLVYLGNNIGSTEHDVNIRISKVWVALNR